MIPAYSTVVKKTGKKDICNSSFVTVVPALDTYELEPSPDTSMVIPNRGASTNAWSPEPLHSSGVLENDYTTTPDPLYSTVVEGVDAPAPSDVEMAPYNPALIKQLKKHDDKGTVQLVSIKGAMGITESQTMSFPQGSSADMQSLHYAAASGDKKRLAESISALPISQDTVEMLLGTEKLVQREGIDVTDSEGRTPLMHAVHNNQLQAVKMLAESGANVNVTANGDFPILMALIP